MSDDLHRIARAAGLAAAAVLLLLPLQTLVFVYAWPLPETARDHFALLQDNWALGLLALDLLLVVDWVLLVVLWLGLYAALRASAPATMRVATAMALLATAVYFASNPAFEMLALSRDYAAAADDAERAALLAAGTALLPQMSGTAFTVSTLLSGLASLAASVVMLRAPGFGRVVGGVGVAYGAMQLVPPSFGPVGMALSIASLLPLVAWLALLAWKLLRLGRAPAADARAQPDAAA